MCHNAGWILWPMPDLRSVCEGLGTTSGILNDTPTTDDSRKTKNELDQAVLDTPHLFAY